MRTGRYSTLESAPWQCLYFLPEPHGQGSLRPTLRSLRTKVPEASGGGGSGGPAGEGPAAPAARRSGGGGSERRRGLGVLRLQRAHQLAVALLFFALDLLLRAHLDGGDEGDGLVFDA